MSGTKFCVPYAIIMVCMIILCCTQSNRLEFTFKFVVSPLCSSYIHCTNVVCLWLCIFWMSSPGLCHFTCLQYCACRGGKGLRTRVLNQAVNVSSQVTYMGVTGHHCKSLCGSLEYGVYAGITTDKLQKTEVTTCHIFHKAKNSLIFCPVWSPTDVVKPGTVECALNHFISGVRQSAGALNPESWLHGWSWIILWYFGWERFKLLYYLY